MKKILFLIIAVTTLFIGLTGCGPKEPTKTMAAFHAQDVIKEKFANDCNFKDMDIRGEQNGDTFIVYQKFTSSRPGYERQFVYKAFADYEGGDPADKSSWNIRTIIVEDIGTKQQWIY